MWARANGRLRIGRLIDDAGERGGNGPGLEVAGLVKTFPGGRSARSAPVPAVDGITFDVAAGQMFTLLGPSGCGKTTALRSIAGLERPDAGEIAVSGRTLFSSTRHVNVPANERGLGMVFQSYAIWPHMNVYRNVAFPLHVLPKRRRPSRQEIRERVEEVLQVVRLDELADRQATDLSGGQQQRLALARALVMRPPLLLLDEPLSNLDAKLREEMRFELKRLQRSLGITAVYVTHDQVEALAMSNRIAVMRDGRIQQVGKPREIYERPSSRFVADFIGSSNFIQGEVVDVGPEGRCSVRTPAGVLRLTGGGAGLRKGSKVVVSIRPERVGLRAVEPGPSAGHGWRGEVQARAFLGESVDHVVAVGSLEIRARCNPSQSLRPGTEVTVTLSGTACTLIPAEE
ncbi:MAG: ABC transporter ATP-binding protein [Actinomycetota bacterium]